MNVTVFTTESYFSTSILAGVVEQPGIRVDHVYLLPASGSGHALRTLRRVVRRSGYRFATYKIVTSAASQLGGILGSLRRSRGELESATSTRELFAEHGIPVSPVDDCNDSALVQRLVMEGPDLILSVNVYQRMREDLLNAPRLAALNCHFGMLPKYQGMSPVIWALSNGESQVGLSIHRMVLEFDQGDLVAQESLTTHPGESVWEVTRRGCEQARHLLKDAVLQLGSDPTYGWPAQGEASYFSLPTRECLRRLKLAGHPLWRWRDLITIAQGVKSP